MGRLLPVKTLEYIGCGPTPNPGRQPPEGTGLILPVLIGPLVERNGVKPVAILPGLDANERDAERL